jgi:hypothetical protein
MRRIESAVRSETETVQCALVFRNEAGRFVADHVQLPQGIVAGAYLRCEQAAIGGKCDRIDPGCIAQDHFGHAAWPQNADLAGALRSPGEDAFSR